METHLHVGQEVIGSYGSDRQQKKADDHVGDTAGCGIEHHQEDGVEQQRRAQVAFENNDQKADAPHQEERGEQAQARNLEAHDRVAGNREQLAVLGEVASQEQDDEDLGELAGLDGKRANANPQLGAVDFGADEHGQDEQQDADSAEGVFITLYEIEILDQGKRCDHERDGHEQDDQLVHGEARRQACDEGDADARKEKDDRQDCRIGAGGEDARGDVRRGEGGEQADGYGKRLE